MRKLFNLFLVIIPFLLIFPQQAIASSIVINEVLPHPSSGSDWIELYNTTSNEVDISGWKIEDTTGEIKTFADGTKIASTSSFLQVTVSNRLNNEGDTVKLKDNSGTIKDERSYTQDPGEDVALGRYPDGSSSWGVLMSASPNGPNSNLAPTPTPIPTATATPVPPAESTVTPTPVPTSQPANTPTSKPKASPTRTPTRVITPTQSITAEAVPTEIQTEVLGESTIQKPANNISMVLLVILLGGGLVCIGAAVILSAKQIRRRKFYG